MTTIVPLVKRAQLLRALSISSDTLRRYMAARKVPPPCTDLGPGQQWWHPDELEAAGIRLRPLEPAASASLPTPAASESAPA